MRKRKWKENLIRKGHLHQSITSGCPSLAYTTLILMLNSAAPFFVDYNVFMVQCQWCACIFWSRLLTIVRTRDISVSFKQSGFEKGFVKYQAQIVIRRWQQMRQAARRRISVIQNSHLSLLQKDLVICCKRYSSSQHHWYILSCWRNLTTVSRSMASRASVLF